MIEQLINKTNIDTSSLMEFIHPFRQYLEIYDTTRILTLILALLIILSLLFFVLVFYIKSVVVFIKQNEKNSKGSTSSSNFAAFASEDEKKEFEKELEKELEMQKLEKEMMVEWHPVEHSIKAKEEKEKNKKIELDWQKNKKKSTENEVETESKVKVMPNISYMEESLELKNLIWIAVDMLSRDVDEFKVAQTLMFKTKQRYSEDDVLQMIDALNSFATLCARGEFSQFGGDEKNAIMHMMQSDISHALLLIEKLMDFKIDQAAKLRASKNKDKVLYETSNLANLFGTLASLSDDDLAQKSFELSLEIYPENINSWNKIGNLYHKYNDREKAIWAFENVLALSDGNEVDFALSANARNMLSKYYYELGDSLKASEYYNESKKFYDMIGINRHLDKSEIEIIKIIEENQEKTITEAIDNFILKKGGNIRIA